MRQSHAVRRLRALAALDFRYIVARPAFWIWVAMVCLITFVITQSGNDLIHSGDSAAGGRRAYITSAFGVAGDGVLVSILLATFFASIVSGLAPIRDDEAGVGTILHATPLRVGEYVWGKLAGVLGACCLIALFQIAFMIGFYYVIPMSGASEWRGPFHLSNFIGPALVFGLPYTFVLVTVSYAIGSAFRQPILIFVLPFGLLTGFFLYSSISNNLPPFLAHALPLFDPSGFIWLQHTYLLNDRGVDFYNNAPLTLTPEFAISRILLILAGLGLVFVSQVRLARVLRNPTPRRLRSARFRKSKELSDTPLTPANGSAPVTVRQMKPLATLRMRGVAPGVWRTALVIARTELDALRRQPGLYLFLPLIIFFCSMSAEDKTGMFSTERIQTAGYLAVSQYDMVAMFVAMLLLAYTVESLERDKGCGMIALENALPVRTLSMLLGRFLALCVVAVLPLIATAMFQLMSIAGQHAGVPLSPGPFILVWGVLLGPSFVVWIAFVMALYTLTGHSRFQTYSWGALMLLVLGFGDKAGWIGNVFLVDSLRWSDLAPLEIDRVALLLSRLIALSLALFFGALACRLFRRRDWDNAGAASRRNVRGITRTLLPLLPLAVIPVALVINLQTRVDSGEHGSKAESDEHDYWKRNESTWHDMPKPGVTDVNLVLDLFPTARTYSAHGTLTLVNYHKFPLMAFAITPSLRSTNLMWTLNGKAYTPDNRAGLYVFTPPGGNLMPDQHVTIGFAADIPDPGPTKDGLGNVDDASGMEFITPSAVVLTALSPRLMPENGYSGEIGAGGEDSRDAADPTIVNPLHESGGTLFGSPTPFALHLTVTAPKDFTVNSVGNRVSQTVSGERRTDVWESKIDPATSIRDFNVVGGKNLVVRRGANGTSIYFYPGHRYNIPEMLRALDAARTWYGTWFAPYPWKELKLTEFPDYAGYAQSFPTNISFGEGMGFLTRSDDSADATDAFAVTAHESAHQWWGNLVVPGTGGGSNVLSEGLAHFSATLLLEKIKGVDARRQFLRHIETEYNRTRSVDSELALANMTGGKTGDQSVTYDKGGWVFTMLSENVMGRANMLRGLRAYIAKYRTGSYHPGIPDMLATLRPFAPDKSVFDSFTGQWFYKVVLPEFTVADLKATQGKPAGKKGNPGWDVSFKLTNVGSGLMQIPITIYGANGNQSPLAVTIPRVTTKPATVTCHIDFKPVRLVVDPDVTILQRGRDAAIANF